MSVAQFSPPWNQLRSQRVPVLPRYQTSITLIPHANAVSFVLRHLYSLLRWSVTSPNGAAKQQPRAAPWETWADG